MLYLCLHCFRREERPCSKQDTRSAAALAIDLIKLLVAHTLHIRSSVAKLKYPVYLFFIHIPLHPFTDWPNFLLLCSDLDRFSWIKIWVWYYGWQVDKSSRLLAGLLMFTLLVHYISELVSQKCRRASLIKQLITRA